MTPASDNSQHTLSSQVVDLTTSIMLSQREAVDQSELILSDLATQWVRGLAGAQVCYDSGTENTWAKFTALPPVTTNDSPLGLQVVRGRVSIHLSERVLAYLSKAELQAPLAERDDIRVAWITVLQCSEGHPDPWRQAFWQYFSETPETLIPFFEARAIANNLPFPDKHLPFRYTRDWPEVFGEVLNEMGRATDCTALPNRKPVQSVGAVPRKAVR